MQSLPARGKAVRAVAHPPNNTKQNHLRHCKMRGGGVDACQDYPSSHILPSVVETGANLQEVPEPYRPACLMSSERLTKYPKRKLRSLPDILGNPHADHGPLFLND